MGIEYLSAQKQGIKKFRQLQAEGIDPYLPVLDNIIPVEKRLNYTDIGTISIPIDYVVGTKSAGRTNSFAGNFMPIEDEKSEFSMKWQRLYNSHLEEGIKDPVLVYEYKRRFYVEEGNKRVSVLKFLDAVEISARVRRIQPEKDDSPDSQLYSEFLEYYKDSGLYIPEFSKPGSYIELCNHLNKPIGQKWAEEEIRSFVATYYRFKKVFKKTAGSRRDIVPGDALIYFLSLYDVDALKSMGDDELKNILSKLWEDMNLEKEGEKVDMKLSPESAKPTLLSIITPTKKMNVAFVYSGTPESSSWVAGHEIGRVRMQKLFGEKIESSIYEANSLDEVDSVLERCAEDGMNVIFVTTPLFMEASVRCALKYPKIKILCCGLGKANTHIRNYYIRMYEPKFVAGAVAGAMCKNDRIGYICKYPIHGTMAEINAFARGAQMTRPDVKIHLEWSSVKTTREILEQFKEDGIDIISNRDFVKLEGEDDGHLFGLSMVSDDQTTILAAPVWKWSMFYEQIINNIMSGTYQGETDKSRKALSYYWGISSGAAEVIYSSKLPKGVRYMAETLFMSIGKGIVQPFYNPLEDASGRIDWDTKDRVISSEDIIAMDWLEDCVIGGIPEFETFRESERGIVKSCGVGIIGDE